MVDVRNLSGICPVSSESPGSLVQPVRRGGTGWSPAWPGAALGSGQPDTSTRPRPDHCTAWLVAEA